MRSIIRNDKLRTADKLSQGCVYELIRNCYAVYSGGTSRSLLDRFKEHLGDIASYKNAKDHPEEATDREHGEEDPKSLKQEKSWMSCSRNQQWWRT
ncbi:hypothetical protein M514_02255, partial [Trichuris suis]